MKPLAPLALGLALCVPPLLAQNDGPIRISDRLPDQFELGIDHRFRFENLDEQYRAGRGGHDQVLLLRTLIDAKYKPNDKFTFGIEIQDSRVFLEDDNTPIGTSIVNTAELLRLYATIRSAAFGGSSELHIGRITMDVGSRRFVARNRYRNTINGFTGVDWHWTNDGDKRFRAFYTLPVRRLPASEAERRDNEHELDEESTDVKFWGLYYADKLGWGDTLEGFVFGLDEKDSNDFATRNRDLITAGFRLYRNAAKGEFDYQIENAYQFGDSRTSTSSTTDLDHSARFHHAEVGYTFDAKWSPRLIFQFDYATGDDDPNDGDNERFDTLFGARRFDFGPTSIYGPFARANLVTPGLRLAVRPSARTTGFLAYRIYELESERDAWTTSGLRDVTGASGDDLGSQLEARFRFRLKPGNILWESGAAYLFAGSFIDNAPNSNRQGDSLYAYSQFVFTF